MTVYLLVLKDRHADDRYTAHRTLEGAKRMADVFMEECAGVYKWEPYLYTDICIPTCNWLYTHITDSCDGPELHIEEVRVL